MTDSTNVDASNPEGEADSESVATPETSGDDRALLSPGSTATGGGTSEGGTAEMPDPEIGTTEADVSDGSEQKLPPVDPPA
jgi:hypothetical protein